LKPAADGGVRTPRGAVGFDYNGARFTHVGARVSFEVLTASFGLETDPALARIGLAVRFLDAGGIPVPEAEGLGAVLSGLQQVHANDDSLVAASSAVFDALYASPRYQP
ncbi:MAG: chromate resistance protein ChrB domain-containing protein, partial [Polaromonas sp.]